MGERRNERLHDVLREAGISRKSFAREVRELSAERGQGVAADHTSVSRWLAGMQPREDTRRLIAEVLGRRLRRTLSTADLGFSVGAGVEPDLGMDYADDPDTAALVLARLSEADLDEAPSLALPSLGEVGSTAALRWLVRQNGAGSARRADGIRVGGSDVEAIRATVETFAVLDNRFGGGHARRALVQYLCTDVSSLLRGCWTEEVGRALYSAVAEASLLAAWMSYDSGHHGLAQRYFVQALRLAQAGDDALLAGSVLDAMSHQATFLGRWREAADLARAARTGTAERATATLTAHFHAMEARALAAGGQSIPAQRALGEAVRVFERRCPGDDPDWIAYFDDAELSAEFAHCFRDLGRHTDAITYADRALAAAGASARSDFFVTLVRAAGQLGAGEIEAACAGVGAALDDGAQLRSARCVEYLRAVRRQLDSHSATEPVRRLVEGFGANRLWLDSAPVGHN